MKCVKQTARIVRKRNSRCFSRKPSRKPITHRPRIRWEYNVTLYPESRMEGCGFDLGLMYRDPFFAKLLIMTSSVMK